MTLKELEKALLGKYIHFTAYYRSEEYLWGGVIKEVEDIEKGKRVRLHLIPYFDDKLLKERNGIMPISQDKLETLVTEGQIFDCDIIYTELLDWIPTIGKTTLVTISFPRAYGFSEDVMFYTIGKNEYGYAGNCAKCSLNRHYCKEYCKKYRCSYLESFYPVSNSLLFHR